MRPSSDDSNDVHRRLDAWTFEPRPDPLLADRVIAEGERRQRHDQTTSPSPDSPLLGWLTRLLQQPGFAGAFAVLFLLLGGVGTLLLLNLVSDHENPARSVEYRLVIDPLYRLNPPAEVTSVQHQIDAGSVDGSLHWLRRELGLDQAQFDRLRALHREYDLVFARLFEDLRTTEDRVQDFEALRRQRELVDFMEVFRVLETFRQLEAESSRSTSEYVSRVSRIVSAEQRHRLLELLESTPSTESERDSLLVPRT